jgi:hypothetical protein
VPKRHCTSRAEWRLQPGKPAQPLSAHYRLDCDYGTAVVACWEDGGSEPIYVCESHAKQVGRAREQSSDVRVVIVESVHCGNPIKGEGQTQIQEVSVAKPTRFVASEAERNLAAKKVERTIADAPVRFPVRSDLSDNPTSSEDRTPIQEVVVAKPKRFIASQAARNLAAKKVERTIADAPVRFPVRSNHSDNPTSSEDRTPIQEVVVAKPDPSAPAAAARNLVATKVERATTDTPVKSPVRDLTYGNPAKAMVDEVIWNLATGNYQVYKTALQQGKSAAEAAQAAGGQLAAVHRKINDYAPKLEAVLAESKATISVAEAIDKPLERAMLEIISNDAMSESDKDAAVRQLGALQEWVKHGVPGDITPLQANGIIVAIGDRLNWGGTVDVSEDLKPVYRALYASLKTAILTAAPEAQNFHDRLTNLYTAKSDLEIC